MAASDSGDCSQSAYSYIEACHLVVAATVGGVQLLLLSFRYAEQLLQVAASLHLPLAAGRWPLATCNLLVLPHRTFTLVLTVRNISTSERVNESTSQQGVYAPHSFG